MISSMVNQKYFIRAVNNYKNIKFVYSSTAKFLNFLQKSSYEYYYITLCFKKN